eukprot:6201008-Pleurochrysis_carterae.AAC.1
MVGGPVSSVIKDPSDEEAKVSKKKCDGSSDEEELAAKNKTDTRQRKQHGYLARKGKASPFLALCRVLCLSSPVASAAAKFTAAEQQ